MHGTNPKRPPLKNHDGLHLDVVNVFHTIQGEGLFAGEPATFIRLGGCNLACDFCDAEFEDYRPVTVDELVAEVSTLSPPRRRGGRECEALEGRERHQGSYPPLGNCVASPPPPAGRAGRLVVITGGEPLRQNIVPLCNALLAKGMRVQIETNGTLYQDLPAAVSVVCSPKNTGHGYAPLRPDVLAQVDALKFIISRTHVDYQDIPEWCQQPSQTLPPIYLQPMDEQDAAKNTANQQYAMGLAMQYGMHLSLQLQKILSIA